MKKLLKYVLPLAVAVTAATAFIVGPATAGAKVKAHPASSKITIGYMNEIDGVPFVQIVKNSVLAAAKKAGVKVDVCNPNGDAQAAVNCAAQFKTEGVQGILNFQADAAAASRVCSAGPKVPVIAFDIVQKPCQTMFYGANNAYAGQLAGKALGKFSKKKFNCKIDAFMLMDDPAVGVVNGERMNGMLNGYKSVCGTPPTSRT
jgi:ribose transport system substrate-binding protein